MDYRETTERLGELEVEWFVSHLPALRFATFINQKTHRVSSYRATPSPHVGGLCQLLESKRPGLCVRFDEDSTKYEDMRDE